jgi:hypothetical protein
MKGTHPEVPPFPTNMDEQPKVMADEAQIAIFPAILVTLNRIADALDVIAYAAMQDGSDEEEAEGFGSLSDH